MTDSGLTRFERHLLRRLASQPSSTAKDLADRLGMGVLPVLAALASLRARGLVVRHLEWDTNVRPARWTAVEDSET